MPHTVAIMLRLHASLVLRERQLSISDTLYDENETLLAVLQLVVCNEGMTSQSCHFQECETHEWYLRWAPCISDIEIGPFFLGILQKKYLQEQFIN